MKGDPLFHALFRKTEDRSVCDRRPTKRPDSHGRALLAASARQHASDQGKDATDRAIMPTTSSSSLSPLRDSPEREIFESFSQLYDLTEPTEGSELGEYGAVVVSQPRAGEERGGSQSDEEDFSQHLALDWTGSPAGRGKRKARQFGYAQH